MPILLRQPLPVTTMVKAPLRPIPEMGTPRLMLDPRQSVSAPMFLVVFVAPVAPWAVIDRRLLSINLRV